MRDLRWWTIRKATQMEIRAYRKAQIQENCPGLNVCVPLPTCMYWNLVLRGMIFGGRGPLGGNWVMNGISALLRWVQRALLLPPHEETARSQQFATWKRRSADPSDAGTLLAGCLPPELWGIQSVLFVYKTPDRGIVKVPELRQDCTVSIFLEI